MKISAIICAAGKGERAGFNKNKLLVPLYGAPVLWHTLNKFRNFDEVIVTSSKEDFDEISTLANALSFKTVLGGDTRTQSVKNALEEVTGDIVLIHDGARPFVTKEIIEGCIESVKLHKSGVCAVPVTDTTVQIGSDGKISYPARESLFAVQTPQGFYTEDIRRAYGKAGDKAYTDDSAVFAEFISSPTLCSGDKNNVKLTFKEDFLREYPLTNPSHGERVGIGCDTHAFGKGDHITLGGVKIACKNSLIAHSDGDVIYHAIIDALFSAAGLKDIGHAFPDNDEKYRGADSSELLKEAVKMVKMAGYAPTNVSVTVQAEHPKLKPHIDKMVENIAKICQIPLSHAAVAAGTCEGLGFVGEGLGISAYCAVTLRKTKNTILL